MHQPPAPIQYYNNSFDVASRHLLDPTLCNFAGCRGKPRCKSLCEKHYREALGIIRSREVCETEGCLNAVKRRGLCKKHYNAFLSENRCKTSECDKIVLSDGLCRKHLIVAKGKCCKPDCKSTKLRDPVLVLCRRHYDEHRKELEKKNQQCDQIETNDTED